MELFGGASDGLRDALVLVVRFDSFYQSRDLAIVYLLFPVTIWAAARSEMIAATAVSAFITVVLVIATINGFGPFYQPEVLESLIFLQSFAFALASTGLVIAVISGERRQSENELLQSNVILEERVTLRTREFEAAKLPGGGSQPGKKFVFWPP